MGEEVERQDFSPEDRRRYRDRLRADLDVLRRMLDGGRFEQERKLMGIELELNLVDASGCPLMMNDEVLRAIESADFQTELGRFNLEVNIAPHKLIGKVFRELEEEIRTSLNHAETKARALGAHIVTIGILPTLGDPHMTVDNFSRNDRYRMLNEAILAARGENIRLEIDGPDRLSSWSESIMPEAAATSTQLHLQVSPEGFASAWNAAQLVAPVQVALGANSPFLLGRELWQETRIPLFQQATDTRSEELVAQGVRPRTWFGERWIGGVHELFEENVRWFPALLPLCSDEDPVATLDRGDVPHLDELRLHNGTIYRWNRPVYDVARGKPHLRVENRVLPAGPTVVDMLANAAFYYGLVRALVDAETAGGRPVWQQVSFSAVEDNLLAAARHGIESRVYWPGVGEVPVTELVLRRLLPLAHDGLRAWEVDDADRERLLGVIEQRCLAGRNGATWQSATFHSLYDDSGLSREEALLEMLARYTERMHANEPVATWD